MKRAPTLLQKHGLAPPPSAFGIGASPGQEIFRRNPRHRRRYSPRGVQISNVSEWSAMNPEIFPHPKFTYFLSSIKTRSVNLFIHV